MADFSYVKAQQPGLVDQFSEGANSLAQILQKNTLAKQQQQAEMERQKLEGQQRIEQLGEAERLKTQGESDRQKASVSNLEDFLKAHPDMATRGAKFGDVDIKEQPIKTIDPFQQAKLNELHQRHVDLDSAKLTDKYNKLNDFNSELDNLENLTSERDVKGNVISGGILTNKNASLKSTGKYLSAAPDTMIGLGELTGALPKGVTEERKSLQRIQLAYQKAMSGLRVTDQARKQEKQAMGYLISGDPSLVAKAVRQLAHNVKNSLKTTQAGYNDEVKTGVHSNMGNPLDRYENLYDDSIAGATSPQSNIPQQQQNVAGSEQSQPNINDIMKQIQELKAKKAAAGK